MKENKGFLKLEIWIMPICPCQTSKIS